MIRCAVCRGRVRSPPRPWAAIEGGVHFYQTTTDMDAYAKEMAKLAKTISFIHEACADAAEPDTLPQPHMIAMNLNARLRQRKR